METATTSLCPDPEALAAFVDQGLRADEVRQIEAHLADCDNCRLIVARVVETKSAVLSVDSTVSPPGQRSGGTHRLLRFSRAHVVWGGGSLLAAAAVLTLMFNVGGRSKLADLAEAVGDERTVEARLTGGFRYGPVRAPVRSGGSSVASSDDWTLLAAAGKIRETAERDPSAPNLHALGVAHLVLGEYDQAVRAIEDAVAEDPAPAQYQSDLAAAYLARAKYLDRPEDLPRALEAAERAVKRDDALKEARFNRALALEALFLEDQARQAWEDYIARDPDSGWANDAREHLQKLQQRPPPQDGARNNSPPPITDTTVEAALDWLVRQGLPAWAGAVLAGDPQQAAIHSSQLSSYAQQIAARNGDPFPVSLAALAQPDANAIPRAKAVRELGRAHALVETDNTASLEPTLMAACAEPEGSLVPLCHLELARFDVVRRRDGPAADHIRRLQGSVETSAYLDGRRELVEGYRLMFRDEYAACLRHYQRAYERLSGAKYVLSAGHIAGQVADILSFLGFPDEGWRWRQRVLGASLTVRNPALRYFLLLGTAEGLARSGSNAAAARFVAALEGPTLNAMPALRGAFADITRSKIAIAEGDLATARAGLGRASAVINGSDDLLGQRLRPDLLMLRASLERAESQLDQARVTLDEAIVATGPERMTHRVTALLTHASISAERPEWHASAEQSIADALRIIQQRDTGVGSQPIRRDDILPAFATAAGLIRAEPSLQSVKGLHLIEQLRQLLEGAPADKRLSNLAEFERALKAATESTIIAFTFTDRTLLSWTVADGQISFTERDITPLQVTMLANRLTVQVNRNPGREDLWRPTLAQLYDLLLRDLTGVRSARELVIVPDGVLHRVPFGSLFDASSGRYVFEQTPVRLVPTVAYGVAGQPNESVPTSALVIGDPEVRGPEARRFPRLAAARREAIAVGRLYRQPVVIVGGAASKTEALAASVSADVVHFAGHAVAAASMSAPRLLLAGDPRDTSNGISAADLTGRIKANAKIILAACETGATTIDRAASLTSISSAFLRAGAGSVVASLWPVDDSSAAEFFPSIHREVLRGARMSAAVAHAQRTCRQDPNCRRAAATWIGTTVYGRP